jgi:hypothetical protein
MSFSEIIAVAVQQAILLAGVMCFFILTRRLWFMSGKEALAYTLMVIMSFALGCLMFGV